MKLKSRLCAIVRRTFLVTFIGSQSLIVAQAQVQGSTDDLAKLNSTDVVAGKGYAAKEGDQLTVLYLGKFKSGQVFDLNTDSQYKPDLEKLPFTFTLGAKQVIAGWDGWSKARHR